MTALATLNEAIDAWRRTRHPRWGQLADWASARALKEGGDRPVAGASSKKADVAAWKDLAARREALDLPRLVAALGGSKSPIAAERVELLAKWDDPRLVTSLLALLEAPPWRAKTALPFFRAVCAALASAKDVRGRDGMLDLAGRFKGILETSVGDDVAALLRRTAKTLEELPAPKLTAKDEQRLAELENSFEAEKSAGARKTSAKQSARSTDDELLAAVYAAPDDDAPRLVFADALLERGDERGELIQLQVKRAQGKATDAALARERELQRDPKRVAQWALPLSNGADCTLARGFPRAAALRARAVKQIIGLEAWATVHEVRGLETLSPKQAKELLLHPAARRLGSIGNLKTPLPLTTDVPWTSVSLTFVPDAGFLARLPRLRRLALIYITGQLEAWKPGVFRPNTALRELAVTHAPVPPLDELTQLEVVDLWNAYPGAPLDVLLPKFERLQTLRLRELSDAAPLRGLPVTHLGVQNLRVAPFDLPPLLPALEWLEWQAWMGTGADLGKLIEAARGTKLAKVTVGQVSLLGVNAPDTTLEFRPHVQLKHFERVLADLPQGLVTKAVLRPWTPNSPTSLGPPVTAEREKELADGLEKYGMSFEVDWR